MANVAGARGGQPSGTRKDSIGGRSDETECDAELWLIGMCEHSVANNDCDRDKDEDNIEQVPCRNYGGFTAFDCDTKAEVVWIST